MYRTAFQQNRFSIFYSVGSKPLNIWETHIKNGYITRLLDPDLKSMVLDIGGSNVSTTYIKAPKGNMVLGISMPFMVMIVKNLKKYFSFEVTILDDSGFRRRFRVSNFQSTTSIQPFCTVMPMGLSDGWNQIQFNLSDFTMRAYNRQFIEVQRVQINANIRLRRVYFAERLTKEEELPQEYRLFFPLQSKGKSKRPSKQLEPGAETITQSKTQIVDVAKQVIEQQQTGTLAGVPSATAPVEKVDQAVGDNVPISTEPAEQAAVPTEEAPPVEDVGQTQEGTIKPTEETGEVAEETKQDTVDVDKSTEQAGEGEQISEDKEQMTQSEPIKETGEETLEGEEIKEQIAEGEQTIEGTENTEQNEKQRQKSKEKLEQIKEEAEPVEGEENNEKENVAEEKQAEVPEESKAEDTAEA